MTVAAHARALVRRRLGLAMHVVHLGPASRCVQCHGQGGSEEAGDCGACEGTGDGRREFALQLLGGGRGFDVAAARACARELIALEDERYVFVEWTKERAKGPDNRETGAFVRVTHRADTEVMYDAYLKMGWRDDGEHSENGARFWLVSSPSLRPGGWPGKFAREWLGDRRAPQGRSLACVGRRLLEALEGQPDECTTCVSVSAPVAMRAADGGLVHATPGQRMRVVGRDGKLREAQLGEACVGPCPECHGTGHNLAGYLPEVMVTPAMMRKRQDAESHRTRRIGNDEHTYGWNDWVNDIHRDAGGPMWNGERMPMCYGRPEPLWTRVVPRGEHRLTRTCGPDETLDLDELITARGWRPAGHVHDKSLLPAWRRGELIHERKRRAARG